jgi:predicted  nucleic acid-binding Zn-ribbon protein
VRIGAVLWAISGALAAADRVSTTNFSTLLLAVLGTSAATALIAWARGRKKDNVDYNAAIAECQTSSRAVVRQVQSQLEEVRKQLTQTQRDLSGAVERVATLEGELRIARSDRERLILQLTEARETRDGLQEQIGTLREQMGRMERALEGKQPRSP